MKFFCDFDGTLIDVSERHYRVYKEVTAACGGVALEKEVYWQLKRSKVSWPDILPKSGLSAGLLDDYLAQFREKIEDVTYLHIDTLYPGALEAVGQLAERGSCYLMSLRRNHDNLNAQLEWLGLAPYFTKILSGHSETDGLDVKVPLIRAELDGDTGVIIGDTETDIRTGQALDLMTVSVTSGLREEQFLTPLHPDHVIPTIAEAPRVLE
jgi:phosphoglycolate phosphatase